MLNPLDRSQSFFHFVSQEISQIRFHPENLSKKMLLGASAREFSIFFRSVVAKFQIPPLRNVMFAIEDKSASSIVFEITARSAALRKTIPTCCPCAHYIFCRTVRSTPPSTSSSIHTTTTTQIQTPNSTPVSVIHEGILSM